MTIPVILTAAGRTNTDPQTLRNNLVAAVSAENPGYTADLPGSLIEDITSTDVGAIVCLDQYVTELLNSISPYSANELILGQLGNMYGVQPGQTTNASVEITFTGTVGYVIAVGFVVSDGTHEYVVQESAIIPAGGVLSNVYCVANTSGSWAIPAGSVTTLITQPPSSITLSCTNPNAGTPQAAAETTDQYRAAVLTAGSASATGWVPTLRTALRNVSGVQQRLVSLRQLANKWEIIVGGGDPYAVAAAIFNNVLDISSLTGSTTTSRNQVISVINSPDSYSITFVRPVQQTVGVQFLWNTTASNFTSQAAVTQLGQPAIINYINSLYVGQPINIFAMQLAFQDAVSSIVSNDQLSRMVVNVTINGSSVTPTTGTGLIYGDVEGYFYTTAASVVIQQG